MNRTAQTVGFTRGERNVFLHLLTACNLDCKHCYIDVEQHGNRSLTLQEAREWIELFADPVKKTNLILLGGEPTLHRDLASIVRHGKDNGFHVTVDSNGFLFNDLLEKCSPEILDYLSFSLDGPDSDVNDPIRGNGVFAVCTENIKKAVEAGYNVSVIYTVSRRNLAALHRMVPLLGELKVKRFFIQVIGLRGKSAPAQNSEAVQVSRKQWLDTVPGVAREAAESGIEVVYPKVFLEPDEIFECAGNVAENFFVFPNGRVYQCPLCEDYPVHSYKIEDGELHKVKGLREDNFFSLDIAEGCVMNKLLQPDIIEYGTDGKPLFKVSCCLLKEKI
jgi:MoaA/NifB/PqqE/SkfB family radical SAM enzyme